MSAGGITLRGQTGEGRGDAGAQADQAMRKIATTLAQSGTTPQQISKLTTHVTDRAWLEPVNAAVARHVGEAARTTLIVPGLAATETLVAFDVEAALGATPEIALPGLIDPDATATVRQHGHSPEAAAAQARSVFARLREHLAQAGGELTDTCKITMQITDRAYRESVYGVLGEALAGVYPVSTGLIVGGLADPDALFQLDAYAVRGGPHGRLRRYQSTDIAYGNAAPRFSMGFCMVVTAGRRLFLRGQTGMDLGRTLIGAGDAAAQARQAMINVRTLLGDAGADFSHATSAVVYVTDRAYLAPVLGEIDAAFGRLVPRTELIVKGLAAPELLMEIDVHARLPD